MSGSSVLKDGHSMIEEYGCDLDQLSEGDVVGVMRTASGDLHFYVNGIDQGVAATGLPSKLYAVIDMYGKCAQVSIIEEPSSDNRTSGKYSKCAQARQSSTKRCAYTKDSDKPLIMVFFTAFWSSATPGVPSKD